MTPKKKHPWRRLEFGLLALLVLAAGIVTGLYLLSHHQHRVPSYITPQDVRFQQVAKPGFDADGQARLADSAWSMRYFQADGADSGYVYVGTDNNILGLTLSAAKVRHRDPMPVQPPQIRRYRPDLGVDTWEVVLDYKDHEQPPYLNQGFRSMAVYRSPLDGVAYLYAGTMADHSPTLWRSATGDPGSWELVFTFPEDAAKVGSVRGMVVHDGLLYFSTTPKGDVLPGGLGTIWATDGAGITPVVTDGFGNPHNRGVGKLASYDGCLYAGTYNSHQGFEVWKLRCTDDPQAPPELVMSGGGGQKHNETVHSMREFQGKLYLGVGIPFGIDPISGHGLRGCQVFRLAPDGESELIVGPESEGPLSEYEPGFGWYLNVYCWYMHEYEDQLYMGTWDMSRAMEWLAQDAEHALPEISSLLDELLARDEDWGSPLGGDLYRTADGIDWEPVFVDGFDRPDNHGIRTMETTDMGMFVGTENPYTRLEVWLLPAKP